MGLVIRFHPIAVSRPTRACELKLFAVMIYLDEFSSHALHGRVS